jgi:NAD(P)H-dependent FMN reductase
VTKPVLQVIIGSTRPGRVGPAVADWIAGLAKQQGDFDVEVTDLAELNLPLFDEPHHPRLRRYVHQHTMDWSAIVDRSDAFIFVIPEYNHTFNAATKNALDYLHQEWLNKPAGIVSYGGASGGAKAARALEPVLAALSMVPAEAAVSVVSIREHLGEDGRLTPTQAMDAAADAMLAELAGRAESLRAA